MVEPIGFSPGKTKSFWKIIQGMGSLWSETRRPGKGSSRWKGALHSKEPEREVRKTLERGAPQAAERPATFLFRPRWPSRVLKALAVFERSLQTEGDRGGSCLPQVHGTGTRCKYPTSSLNYIHKMEGKERKAWNLSPGKTAQSPTPQPESVFFVSRSTFLASHQNSFLNLHDQTLRPAFSLKCVLALSCDSTVSLLYILYECC